MTLAKTLSDGITSDERIAYASQYTDDAVTGRPVKLEDGDSFNRVLTSYREIRIANITLDIQERTFLPFHFIPRLKKGQLTKNKPREAFTTAANCELANRVLDTALASKDDKCYHQKLGIALHTYIDNWSHQNFSGLFGPENDTESLKYSNRGRVSSFFRIIWSKIMELL